ncbi:hypothetical Protein pso3_06450 [Candidatus Phytoplasma solani]
MNYLIKKTSLTSAENIKNRHINDLKEIDKKYPTERGREYHNLKTKFQNEINTKLNDALFRFFRQFFILK